MGCANSHSEDIHKTSLLESDKFVTSLQDVPGYFNRTIQTSDFLPPKFPDAPPEKQEMSYTGPPSHLRNSVDFHPYWHLLQQEYIPNEPIKESDGEIPPSLLPSTETAQEMRDIVVREAITDLRQRVKETLAEKLKENEDEYLTDNAQNGGDGEITNNDIYIHQTPLEKGEPPPLPEADYTDGDDDLAQAEKDTIDFLDSVINESMVWDEETGEELVMERRGEDGNWSFAPPDGQGEEVMNYHVPDSNKPFPGINLDIASNTATPPNSSPTAFSKSIYLPEDKSSFISNNVIAKQTSSSHIGSTLDKKKQVTKPKMRKKSERTEKQSPTSPNSSGRVSPLSSPVHVPPPPPFRPPPPPTSPPQSPSVKSSQALPKEELHSVKIGDEIGSIPNGRVSSDSSPKAVPPLPPSPPPPPAPPLPSMERRHSSQVEENKRLSSPAKVVSPSRAVVSPPSSPPPPPASRPPPPPSRKVTVENNGELSDKTEAKQSVFKDDSKINSKGTKAAPPPAPKPKAKPSRPPAVKTKPVRHSMVELPRENERSKNVRHSMVELPSENEKTKNVRHSMVELPSENEKTKNVRHSMVELPRENEKTKPVRNSMVELPRENDIADELPSDDSGIREEPSEKSIQDIIKNLKLENPSQTTATLERKSKAKVPPPPAKKPKAPRPVSMPPPATPPLVKPKPQRKVHGQSNGTLPHGNVSRTSSFSAVNRGTSSKRNLSDDASSEDSGLHMKEVEDTDILSQIRLDVT